MDKIAISLVVITLNEELNIRRCIESVPFVNDIVVLDSGSRDRTQEIANALGARVFDEEWRGYALQKQRAAELAKNEWVLSLDADEALSERAQKSLLKAYSRGLVDDCAYQWSRRSFHLGRWINHGGWYPDRQTRLYHRNKTRWIPSDVHERLSAEKIEKLEGDILHWVFKDLAHQVETNNRYSTLGTQVLAKKGKRFSLFLLCTKPVSKFLETYIFKKGILDGLPGFIISIGAAYSIFLKYAKLYEHENIKSEQK